MDGKYITKSPWLAMGQEYNRKVFDVHKSSILLYDDALGACWKGLWHKFQTCKFPVGYAEIVSFTQFSCLLVARNIAK